MRIRSFALPPPYRQRLLIAYTSYPCSVLLFPLCLGLVRQYVGTVGFGAKTGTLFSVNFIKYSTSCVLDFLNILRGMVI